MPASIESDIFGTTSNGEQVKRYTLKNENDITIQILDFGGIVTSIVVPDKDGNLADVTTGFDTLAEYEVNPAYFGAVIGRVANRIYEGKFQLDGANYTVSLNQPPNSLHGGNIGFDKKVFTSCVEGSQLLLSYSSADGEEGYPGTLQVNVTYELTADNELYIEYKATTDKTTIVNLTNQAYFNLNGHKATSIFDHKLTVCADHYLPITEYYNPTGIIASVQDTPFDMRQQVMLGERIPKITGPPSGFAHNFCLKADSGKNLAATLEHPASGRSLEVYTNQPGIIIYTANFFNSIAGKQGAVYEQHSSIALETQNHIDAIHHSNFPSCVLRPDEVYLHKTWYKFKTS